MIFVVRARRFCCLALYSFAIAVSVGNLLCNTFLAIPCSFVCIVSKGC